MNANKSYAKKVYTEIVYRPAVFAHDVDWGRGKQFKAGDPCEAAYKGANYGSLIYIKHAMGSGICADSVVKFTD